MDNLNINASYGAFDCDMEPIMVIDVAKIVVDNFLLPKEIIIPSKTDFNQYFGDPCPEQRKFLQLQIGKRKYNIVEDSYNQDIRINLNEESRYIKLVYYVYINRNSNWKAIVSGQLLQLKSYGILQEVELYIHITDTSNIFDDVINTIEQIYKGAIISKSNENHFEFPAIKLVYDLAKKEPNSIFIYLHTKGMSFNTPVRLSEEIVMLAGTFEKWRRHLELFHDKKINKIGLFPAIESNAQRIKEGKKGGWIFFNFWFARGSYLTSCEQPVIKTDRYYWEDWLGGTQNEKSVTNKDCYSLYDQKDQTYFTSAEAVHEILHFTEILKSKR